MARTTIAQDAWRRGQVLSVHGWIYELTDGLIRDLGVTLSSAADLRAERGAPPAAGPRRTGAGVD